MIVFMPAIKAGMNSGYKTRSTYSRPPEKSDYKWHVGDREYHCLDRVATDVSKGYVDLAPGKNLKAELIKKTKVKDWNPKDGKKMLIEAGIEGAVTAGAFVLGFPVIGYIAAGFGLVSLAGAVAHKVKAKKMTPDGYKKEVVNQVNLSVMEDEKEGKNKLMSSRIDDKGKISGNKNPAFLAWIN